jgi:WNT inhibitory factor 1
VLKWYSLSGISMEIHAIVDGHVLPYILDPNFERYLPIIPSEVSDLQYISYFQKLEKY